MGNYLYNGVSLPPLVGWDGMPPAGIFILHDSRNGTYVLCGVSAAPQCVLVNGEDEPALPFDVFGTVFVALEGAESWGESQNFEPLEYFSATESAYIRQRYVGWLWSQSDILTADGQNIYMAATAPIKVAEDSGITIDDVRRHYRRGYTAGVVFGRNSGGNLEGNSAVDVAKASKNAAIPAVAYSVKPRDNTPGNYLYNGVELPPLPHWDDMPPFGVFIIYIASEQLYRLYGANDAPFCIKTAGAEKIAFSADIFGSYQKARAGETNWFGLKAFDGNLSDIADFEDGIYILRSENKIIWTKETIFNSDGQSVFLAATEPIKIELPEQLTEADLRRSWRRGMALGVVVGVKARKIIAQTQPPPDEPITADYYLYGRPSESGEVALADGDGYVLYNGAVLAKLPEWDKTTYPYAMIVMSNPTTSAIFGNQAWLYCFKTAHHKTAFDEDANDYKFAFEAGETYLESYINVGAGSLSDKDFPTPTEKIRTEFYIFSPDVDWSNYDIQNNDGSLYLAASAPIPLASADPVAAVYGRDKLPPLPEYDTETHPYAVIVCYRDSLFKNHTFHLWLMKDISDRVVFSPSGLDTYTIEHIYYHSGDILYSLKYNKGNLVSGWGEPTDASGRYSFQINYISWANSDIVLELDSYIGSAGTLYRAKSTPIPIYEQKE